MSQRGGGAVGSLELIAGKIQRTWGEKECENNWEAVDTMLRQAAVIIHESHQTILVSAFLRQINTILLEGCLQSERTRLASGAMELLSALEKHPRLDPQLWESVVTSLLRICEKTNRIFVTRAMECLKKLVNVIPARILWPELVACRTNANKGLRQSALEVLETSLSVLNEAVILEHQNLIRSYISESMHDAAINVRDAARKTCLLFNKKCPCAVIESSKLRNNQLNFDDSASVRSGAGPAPSIAYSGISRASSTVLRAPRIAGAKQPFTILGAPGPQRMAPPPTLDSDIAGPKKATRVSSNMLANSLTAHGTVRAPERAKAPTTANQFSMPTSPSISTTSTNRTPQKLASGVASVRPTPAFAAPKATSPAAPKPNQVVDNGAVRKLLMRPPKISSDWQERLKAVEELMTALKAPAPRDLSSFVVSRAAQFLTGALADVHPRINSTGLQLLEVFVEYFYETLRTQLSELEPVVVKLLSLQDGATKRITSEEIDRALGILQSCLKETNMLSLLLACLARAEVSSSAKLRQLFTCRVDALLASSEGKDLLAETQMARLMVSRMAPYIEDCESAREAMLKLYVRSLPVYCLLVQQLVRSQNAKRLLREMTEKHDENRIERAVTENRTITADDVPMTPVQKMLTPLKQSSGTYHQEEIMEQSIKKRIKECLGAAMNEAERVTPKATRRRLEKVDEEVSIPMDSLIREVRRRVRVRLGDITTIEITEKPGEIENQYEGVLDEATRKFLEGGGIEHQAIEHLIKTPMKQCKRKVFLGASLYFNNVDEEVMLREGIISNRVSNSKAEVGKKQLFRTLGTSHGGQFFTKESIMAELINCVVLVGMVSSKKDLDQFA